MPPYQAFTFKFQHLGSLPSYLLYPRYIRIHACAFSFLLTDNRYSAFNRDSSYLSLDNQYKRTTAFNTTPSKFLALQLFAYT